MKITVDLLKNIVNIAAICCDGDTANYIPELANVDKDLTALALQELNGNTCHYANREYLPTTLQSTAKLIPLIGLLEEYGVEQVLDWVKVEPSGDDFASITRLERFGPKPSNPMLNAGAIALCSRIPGSGAEQFAWLDQWTHKLFNQKLAINDVVFKSEKRTGDRNRAMAYLLLSRNNLGTSVPETLDLYFSLCSYEAKLEQMLYLPTLLANGGRDPLTQVQVIDLKTCQITLAIMATCGLYDETGTHMVKTGMPAKSGVSGYTIAVVPGKAGIVALSPRVNGKGNSIRGEIMLEQLSIVTGWHFASP